jgi:peptidoglycan hydrolase-like protein with peptidoglycan-binding domain
VTYQGERLYLCDGVLYRATIHKDEPVYEIVTEPDEVITAEGVSVGAFQDDRPLMLTSPRVQGPRVLDLQQALVDRGYDLGAIDGVFGPATDQAVRAFQRDAGLEESGVTWPGCGRQTAWPRCSGGC